MNLMIGFSYYEEKFTGNWKKYFELGKDTGLYNSGSIHFALKIYCWMII